MRRSRSLRSPANVSGHPVRSAQLPLPLPADAVEESLLRHAWRRTRLPLSFEAAMQVPALAICLRCLGEAQARRAPAPVQPEHQSRRRPGREQAFSELDLALALPMA